MVLFRTTLSSDLPVSRHMDTIAAGSVLRSHGLYPSLAINRLYTLILGQPPRFFGPECIPGLRRIIFHRWCLVPIKSKNNRLAKRSFIKKWRA